MTEGLETRFEREMWRLYKEPKEQFGYNAAYFGRMLANGDALSVARRLIREQKHSDGLTFLYERKALHLSVEALVLRDPWNKLFSEMELHSAWTKLKRLDYSEPDAWSPDG